MTAILDTEKFKSRKVNLCKFMNGKVKDEDGDKLVCRVLRRTRGADIKTQDNKILVSESPDMTYVGQNYGRRHGSHTNKTLKHYVGVYDESTGKMRVCDAQLFHLMPHIPGSVDVETSPLNDLPSEANLGLGEKLSMLTEAFGSKWKKSSLEKMQRNRVDVQTMKDHLAADIDHGKEQAKTYQQKQADTETGLEITPPCNKNAENVEDVYILSDIISDIDMGALYTPAALLFDSTPEQIKTWTENETYPAYVLLHASTMPLDAELRWKRSKCLMYLHYMIHLYKLTPKELRARDPYLPDCPANIRNKLKDNFTKDAYKTKCMPSRLKDRLAAYIMTLCLLIDEFTVDLYDIIRDMQIERTKLFLILKTLGCKINKKVRKEEEKYFARIKLPLEFPQRPLFKKQGSSRKR